MIADLTGYNSCIASYIYNKFRSLKGRSWLLLTAKCIVIEFVGFNWFLVGFVKLKGSWQFKIQIKPCYSQATNG